MKRMLINWRYYALISLAGVAVTGLFSMPCENLGLGAWAASFAASKAIGIGAAFACIKLMEKWVEDRKIPELENYLTEEN